MSLVTLITLLIIAIFIGERRRRRRYIWLTEKGRAELAALLMKEIEKNPDLLNDSDDD